MKRTKKKISDSAIEMREMVMPQHTNPQNTVFGGVVMSWIDIAAAMVSARHCCRPVVTVHIDGIDFIAPIKMGYHAHILASMNYVGKTSMIVGVKVVSENPFTGECRTTTKAYLTFVALDDLGRPVEVPELELESDEDRRRFENAKKRVEASKQLKNQLTSRHSKS
jgi:acyl-CoA hydrolase